MKSGSFQHQFEDVHDKVPDWKEYIRIVLLPQCKAWTDLQKHQAPIILDVSLASEWSPKHGPTTLGIKAYDASTVEKMLSYFRFTPKTLWIIVEFEEDEDVDGDNIAKDSNVKRSKNRTFIKVSTHILKNDGN
jgi:hypothetical protein